jgi:hypothetical protein
MLDPVIPDSGHHRARFLKRIFPEILGNCLVQQIGGIASRPGRLV